MFPMNAPLTSDSRHMLPPAAAEIVSTAVPKPYKKAPFDQNLMYKLKIDLWYDSV